MYMIKIEIVFIVLVECNLFIKADQSDFSISPDGYLSILRDSNGKRIDTAGIVINSPIWAFSENNNEDYYKYSFYEDHSCNKIDPNLESITHVIAIRGDKFVYLGEDYNKTQRIGLVQLNYIFDQIDTFELEFTVLNNQTVDNPYETLMTIYDHRLENRVYFFSAVGFFMYNLHTFEINSYSWLNSSDLKNFHDLSNIIVVGENYFLLGFGETSFRCEKCPSFLLVEIDSFLEVRLHSYETINLSEYDDFQGRMVMSINDHNDLAILFQEINLIAFGNIDLNIKRITINTKKVLLDQAGQLPSHSVLWVNNTRQLAVLFSNAPLTQFANSSIFFFNYEDEDLRIQNVFPNKQQRITYEKEDQVPSFSNLININGNYLGISAEYPEQNWYLLIIPLISSKGKEFIDFGGPLDDDLIYRFATFAACLPGMYKNSNRSLEQCVYCPTGEKTSKSGSIQCEKCEKKENCPLAALSDEFEYKNVNQIVSYPSKSNIDSFDDIILSNMFHFQCLSISPAFWMFLVISIVLFLAILVFLCSYFPSTFRYRLKIHQILSHIDLITEGQLWIGGVVSCGIFVLVTFAALFSFEYMNLYPIENFRSSSFVCDSDIVNAKFTSGLQLLALPKTNDERPIFDLLDGQPFQLVFHLINTNLDCVNSRFDIRQKNGDYFTSFPSFNCSMKDNNATLALVVTLLTHVARTTIKISSVHPIAILQICLQGSNRTIDDGKYVLRSLFACNVFSDANHTIDENPELDITLTKVVNRTESLEGNQQMQYSGLWIPLITGKDITTKTRLAPTDEYLRYLSLSTTISIQLRESQFFIQNTQEPIARKYEILFRNVLFLGVVIELFSLTFLICKLLLRPIIHLTYQCFIGLCLLKRFKRTKSIEKTTF
ncbi:unnamed protein product [Adineta ricciae]|uniref:Uncharacterized protein n=1 Tax=Adineta ricciae TaxID=249248 RepID=A0A814FJ97_ADIRI|nr:unnamed protein product [Adineta ricciae]CAF1394817.1 unnamed protein product [Adineta ricciae]